MYKLLYVLPFILIISCSEEELSLSESEDYRNEQLKNGYDPLDPSDPFNWPWLYPDMFDHSNCDVFETELSAGGESFSTTTHVDNKYGFVKATITVTQDGKIVAKIKVLGSKNKPSKLIDKAYKKLKKKSKSIRDMPEDEAKEFIKKMLGIPDWSQNESDNESFPVNTEGPDTKSAISDIVVITQALSRKGKFDMEHWGTYSLTAKNEGKKHDFYFSMKPVLNKQVAITVEFDFPNENYNQHYQKLIRFSLSSANPNIFRKELKSELQKYIEARLVGVLDEKALEEFIRKVLFPIDPTGDESVDDLLVKNK